MCSGALSACRASLADSQVVNDHEQPERDIDFATCPYRSSARSPPLGSISHSAISLDRQFDALARRNCDSAEKLQTADGLDAQVCDRSLIGDSGRQEIGQERPFVVGVHAAA